MRLTVESDPAEVAARAAELTVDALAAAIADRGRAIWVLAGGTSPTAAYRTLVAEHATALDWSRVLGFVGDERCVPLDHPDSNTGSILAVVGATDGLEGIRILRPRRELDPEAMRDDFEQQILSGTGLSATARLRPDVTWLGVGEDGHTLSHFPGRDSLADGVGLVQRISDSPKPPSDRITLSAGAVEGSVLTLVFVVGGGKRDALHAVLRDPQTRPIGRLTARIEAAGGRVEWLADVDAVVPRSA